MRVMQHKALWLVALTLGLSATACGDDKTPAGSDAAVDTVESPDVAPDAQPDVAGQDVQPDIAVADVAADVVPPQDLGDGAVADAVELDDVVSVDAVADTSVTDAATPLDVAADSGPDVIVPPAESVFVDGSFEYWVDGLPVGWYGSASNISTDNVAEELVNPKEGLRSCLLANVSDTHKRFSSAPQAFETGRYTCTYWVRGIGEIRNARYNGTTDSFSSYSSYTAVSSSNWSQLRYEFNVPTRVPSFELVFSVRNASSPYLRLDDVRCTRAAEPCDAVTCEAWQICNPTTVACQAAPNLCDDGDDCEAWQLCDETHSCVLAPDFCLGTVDCGGATPVCDLSSHLCVAGDPCAGVVCDAWKQCDPTDSGCDVSPGRCDGLADCSGATPVCDRATHTCVAIDNPQNVVPNGGFEAWSTDTLGASSVLLPDYWYGLYDGTGTYFPATEITTANVRYYTAATQSGTGACQLVKTGVPADRFTTEPFTVVSGATYDCAYWVRGHGTMRHRSYCGAWGPDTDFVAYDSNDWQQVRFSLSGGSSKCVLIFYPSNTAADRDHLQLDDVVCIRR